MQEVGGSNSNVITGDKYKSLGAKDSRLAEDVILEMLTSS